MRKPRLQGQSDLPGSESWTKTWPFSLMQSPSVAQQCLCAWSTVGPTNRNPGVQWAKWGSCSKTLNSSMVWGRSFIGEIWGEGWRMYDFLLIGCWWGNRAVLQESCVCPWITILHLCGGHSSAELIDIVTYIPWGGARTLPQGWTNISWLFLLCFYIPSLPRLATVWKDLSNDQSRLFIDPLKQRNKLRLHTFKLFVNICGEDF